MKFISLKNIIWFLGLIILGILLGYSANLISKKFKPTGLKIGYITDAHCEGDLKKTGEWRLNWRCREPLAQFNRTMVDYEPDFILEGGDLIDGKKKDWENNFNKINAILKQTNVPVYHVLGNHESRDLKIDFWVEKNEVENNYYYFDKNNYRIIVLDGNYVPGGKKDTHVNENIKYYTGYINETQFSWLEKVLENSNDRMGILIFVHQPTVPKTIGRPADHMVKNANQLRDLFAKHKVLAVISGHFEEFCSFEIDGVKYYTLQGFYKDSLYIEDPSYTDAGVFSTITLDNRDITLNVFYRNSKEEPYQSFILNQQSTECNNQIVDN
jgi:UDP-2,3-diacylglucosamine pyrophosphatase LpxH